MWCFREGLPCDVNILGLCEHVSEIRVQAAAYVREEGRVGERRPPPPPPPPP